MNPTSGPGAPGLDAAALVARVRAVLKREVERVDDPVAGVAGGDPSDENGWYPARGGPARAPRIGRPFYNAETWRWFELVDVAYVDELVVVVFRWTDPATPPALRYVIFCHVDRVAAVDSAAWIVRMQLRRQLAPGWRERLEHRWLGRHHPVLFRPDDAETPELDEHFWHLR